MKTGIELIQEERQEQINKHRWDDSRYQNDELQQAGMYAFYLAYPTGLKRSWPDDWSEEFHIKLLKKDRIGKLKVAGAFFMADEAISGLSHKVQIELIASLIDGILCKELLFLSNREEGRKLQDYRETIKFALNNAIENQEQENSEVFNRGREEAFKYALEMLDKHVSPSTPLEQKELNGWISVKDKLPEPNVRVRAIRTFGNGRMEETHTVYIERTECFDDFHTDIITHWQPIVLPLPLTEGV